VFFDALDKPRINTDVERVPGPGFHASKGESMFFGGENIRGKSIVQGHKYQTAVLVERFTTDPQVDKFKIDPGQLEVATKQIHDEIRELFKKKDLHVPDPNYLKKLDAAFNFADNYLALSPTKQYQFVIDLGEYDVQDRMDVLTKLRIALELQDLIYSGGDANPQKLALTFQKRMERSKAYSENYSDELYDEILKLIRTSWFFRDIEFTELGAEEIEFMDRTNRKRILPNFVQDVEMENEVQEAINANGKRKDNRVFTEPFLPKKRRAVKKVGPAVQLSKTKYARPMDDRIPIVREQRIKKVK